HAQVDPVGAARGEELADLPAVRRIREAGLEQRDLLRLTRGPAHAPRELAVEAEHAGVGLEQHDHRRNGVEDLLQELLLVAQRLFAALALQDLGAEPAGGLEALETARLG